MNNETAKILCKLNNDFYRSQTESFSETRKAPWEGWKRALSELHDNLFQSGKAISVCDMACGNLRFVEFLLEGFSDTAFEVYAVDDCDGLVPEKGQVHFQKLDIVSTLLEGKSLSETLDIPLCDLTVCFGFMHHVPFVEYRKRLLDELIARTRVGGYVVISFWEFLNNDDLKKKALATHKQGCCDLGIEHLDEGDYLLGWRNIPGVYRYCHNFTEHEIAALLNGVSERVQVVSRFLADGRTGNLNSYVVFRVCL